MEMDTLKEFLRKQLELSNDNEPDSSSLSATQLAAQLVERFRELRVLADDQQTLINQIKEKMVVKGEQTSTPNTSLNANKKPSGEPAVIRPKISSLNWSKVSERVGILQDVSVGISVKDENSCVSTPPANGSSPGLALLRAKEAVIDRLNRRIKVLESKAGLEVTVQHLAHREAMFERERNRLRNENEKLRQENAQLRQQILGNQSATTPSTTEGPTGKANESVSTSAVVGVSNWSPPSVCPCGKRTRVDDLYAYLQRTVIRYFLLSSQKDSRSRQEEIAALMPVLCALSNATEAEAKTILRSCQLPSPRHYT